MNVKVPRFVLHVEARMLLLKKNLPAASAKQSRISIKLKAKALKKVTKKAKFLCPCCVSLPKHGMEFAVWKNTSVNVSIWSTSIIAISKCGEKEPYTCGLTDLAELASPSVYRHPTCWVHFLLLCFLTQSKKTSDLSVLLLWLDYEEMDFFLQKRATGPSMEGPDNGRIPRYLQVQDLREWTRVID